MNQKTTIFCAAFALMVAFKPVTAKASTDEDKAFLQTAAQSDQNEIALSQVAKEKATNPAVKQFAGKMITDHTKLSATMKPYADEWSITPPSGPDADHQSEVNKLQGLSGGDFDKEYISQMVADHQKALDAFTAEAKNTTDVKFRTTVTKGKTIVAEHTKMASALQKKI